MRREALSLEEIHMLPGCRKRKCQWKRGRNWTNVLQPRYGLPMFAKLACPLADLSVFSTSSHRRRGPPQDQVLQPSSARSCSSSPESESTTVSERRHPTDMQRRTGPPRGPSAASKMCLAKLACPMLDLSVFASHIRGVDGLVCQEDKQAWLDISESESYRCNFGNLNHKTFLDEFGRWTELAELAVAVICTCKITHAVLYPNTYMHGICL